MSSRLLYLEPVGGIAGDMFLAAALDLGLSQEAIEAPLRTLPLSGWRLSVKREERHHLWGTHVDVVVEGASGDTDGHLHRTLADIEALIGASKLSEAVQNDARRVFRLVGEAEARIHGTTLESVSFHEVGAVDSIIDICGAALVLELLGNPRVYASPPPVGSGLAHIAHGVVPVPVPATLELLRGVPVRFEGEGELTTPTGAALLKAFATVAPPPSMVVERIGYGVGTKDWKDRANVLRASLGHVSTQTTTCLEVLECNVDDCSPQVLGALVEQLLAQGALDAWVIPVVMKKGRPGHLVGVLTDSGTKTRLEATLLEETTTLGVRATSVTRTELERELHTVETSWGPVHVKVGRRGGKILNATPEFEDCRSIAQRAGIPLKQVLAAAQAAFEATRRAEHMQFAGILSSGDPNVSSTIDEVVYGREQP